MKTAVQKIKSNKPQSETPAKLRLERAKKLLAQSGNPASAPEKAERTGEGAGKVVHHLSRNNHSGSMLVELSEPDKEFLDAIFDELLYKSEMLEQKDKELENFKQLTEELRARIRELEKKVTKR